MHESSVDGTHIEGTSTPIVGSASSMSVLNCAPSDEFASRIQAAKCGDRQAAAALFILYRPLVASVAARHVGRHCDVDDVVQETFARALSGLDQLRCSDSFVAWLTTIARYVAIDLRRRGTRASLAAQLQDWPDPVDHLEMTAVDIPRLVSSIREGLKHLSPRDAELLRLVAATDVGPREISEQLGISSGAAKVAVHRARRRLRAAMA